MADIHLSSTGSNTSPYDTWAKAATTWITAAGAMSAGDRLLVDNTFATTFTTAINITFVENAQVLSGVPAVGSGLSSLAKGAICAPSSTTGTTINGIGLYVYGVEFRAGNSGLINLIFAAVSGNKMVLDNCTFVGPTGGGLTRFGAITSAGVSVVELRDCEINPNQPSGYVGINGHVRILGGRVSYATNNLFYMGVSTRGADLQIAGLDMSAVDPACNVLVDIVAGPWTFSARDCILPGSFTGTLTSTAYGVTAEWWNCASTNTTYRVLLSDGLRTISDETTIVRSGGATDGTTPLAWKVATTAYAAAAGAAKTPPIVVINTAVGSAINIAVEVAHSAAALTDATAWLEVEYMGSASSGISTALKTRGGALSTPVAHVTSAANWGGGPTTKQTLTASFTPQKAGPFNVRVCFAIPSTTFYVDPSVTIY